jgi:hypothetical protein
VGRKVNFVFEGRKIHRWEVKRANLFKNFECVKDLAVFKCA